MGSREVIEKCIIPLLLPKRIATFDGNHYMIIVGSAVLNKLQLPAGGALGASHDVDGGNTDLRDIQTIIGSGVWERFLLGSESE